MFALATVLSLTAAVVVDAAWLKPESEFGRVSRDLAKAAEKAGVRRVAVVPFRDQAGRLTHSGAVVADRLTLHLVQREVEVVERVRLADVMGELKLGMTGALDGASVKRLGRVLGVDAIVSGTLIELVDSRVEAVTRLVEVETARVLAASSATLEKDWAPDLAPREEAVLLPGAAEQAAARPRGSKAAAAPAREVSYILPGIPLRRGSLDSQDEVDEGESCEASDGRVLDARARYWAIRLREPGFTTTGLKENPGSEIADRAARRRFYEQLRAWHAAPEIPPLTRNEQVLIAICR